MGDDRGVAQKTFRAATDGTGWWSVGWGVLSGCWPSERRIWISQRILWRDRYAAECRCVVDPLAADDRCVKDDCRCFGEARCAGGYFDGTGRARIPDCASVAWWEDRFRGVNDWLRRGAGGELRGVAWESRGGLNSHPDGAATVSHSLDYWSAGCAGRALQRTRTSLPSGLDPSRGDQNWGGPSTVGGDQGRVFGDRRRRVVRGGASPPFQGQSGLAVFWRLAATGAWGGSRDAGRSSRRGA